MLKLDLILNMEMLDSFLNYKMLVMCLLFIPEGSQEKDGSLQPIPKVTCIDFLHNL